MLFEPNQIELSLSVLDPWRSQRSGAAEAEASTKSRAEKRVSPLDDFICPRVPRYHGGVAVASQAPSADVPTPFFPHAQEAYSFDTSSDHSPFSYSVLDFPPPPIMWPVALTSTCLTPPPLRHAMSERRMSDCRRHESMIMPLPQWKSVCEQSRPAVMFDPVSYSPVVDYGAYSTKQLLLQPHETQELAQLETEELEQEAKLVLHLKRSIPADRPAIIVQRTADELESGGFTDGAHVLRFGTIVAEECRPGRCVVIKFSSSFSCRVVLEALTKQVRSCGKDNVRQPSPHFYVQGYVISSAPEVRDTKKYLKQMQKRVKSSNIGQANGGKPALVLYIGTPVLFFGRDSKISNYGEKIKREVLTLAILRRMGSLGTARVKDCEVLWLHKEWSQTGTVNYVCSWVSTESAIYMAQAHEMKTDHVPLS